VSDRDCTLLYDAIAAVKARTASYGGAAKEFARTAAIWSAILGVEVSPAQVGLCMIGLKLAREAYRHNRDNLIDMAGYAQCVAECEEEGE
jgi:hypothetical protein